MTFIYGELLGKRVGSSVTHIVLKVTDTVSWFCSPGRTPVCVWISSTKKWPDCIQVMDKTMETLDIIRIKLCVGCTERTLVVSFVILFVCLCCVMPVSVQYRLCLVTVHMKVLQNGRLVKLSKRTACWCMFSWSICNQNGHFVRCIQSSSFQSYDGIHKLWDDIIS